MITQAEINHLVQGFQKQTLPKEEWTHQAHLIVGMNFVMTAGLQASYALMREGVKSYNLSVGTQNTDTGGYHESITIFFLHALDGFRNQLGKEQTFINLANQFDGSLLMDEEFIFRFYSKRLLFSVQARRSWVEPDLQPLSSLCEIDYSSIRAR